MQCCEAKRGQNKKNKPQRFDFIKDLVTVYITSPVCIGQVVPLAKQQCCGGYRRMGKLLKGEIAAGFPSTVTSSDSRPVRSTQICK